jgi:dTMP kinase
MFFVFDGMDGAGKTTQLQLFAQWLTQHGHDVVVCKDPGTTELGETLRQVLLGKHQIDIHLRSELLMFMAARAQLVEEVIRPALAAGKIVVSDRYVFSTVVYQGYAGNIEPDTVWDLNHFATDGLMADMTFLFDLDTQTALSRLGPMRDRMESRGQDYFNKLRNGFVAEAKRWPAGVELVDASGSLNEVQQKLRELASGVIQRKRQSLS